LRGFRPVTSPTAVTPTYTPVTAGLSRNEHLDPAQDDTGKKSFETVIPDNDREQCRKDSQTGTHGSIQWDENNPVALRKSNGPGLKGSRSVSEGLRNLRERLSRTSGRDIPGSPRLDDMPSMPDLNAEDVRTSFRSAVTSNSSFMDSTASTERSSMATGHSSTSDFVKVYPSWPQTSDEDFSVEDAIGMYAEGFGTPSKRSIDVSRASDTVPRPASSPVVGPDQEHAHRRSYSVAIPNGPMVQVHEKDGTLSVPRKTHVRSSTQIIAGHGITSEGRDSPEVSVDDGVRGITKVPRDRYGFKKVSHHITLEQFDEWEKSYEPHLGRRKLKWDGLMKQYGLSTEKPTRFPPKSDKIKRYVRKGIPPKWRGNAWFWYAGGPGLQKQNEGLYFNLLLQIKRGGALKDVDKEHIERDLHRTFPDNILFKPDPLSEHATNAGGEPDSGGEDLQPETSIVRALRRVLQAFAVHKPDIGYCQSLNFIVGLLLVLLEEDEEKTFILLNIITSEHLPGTHGISLEGANIDIAVLMMSLKESLPAIWVKLDDKPPPSLTGGPPPLPTVSLATTAWFMSLFVGTLPMECVLRVWDCLFFEGSKTLFRVALAIFKSGESQIKAVNDPMEVFQVVQSMPRSMIDPNMLMETCFRKRGGFGSLSQDTVEKRRQERRQETRKGRTMTGDLAKKKHPGIKGRLRSKTKGG